jgi:type III secretion protein R
MQEIPFRDPFFLIVTFVLLGLMPFAIMMVTSYIKLSVVTSLIRNALGVQQIPPNMVINGLAIILTIYIMTPIGEETLKILQSQELLKKDFRGMVEVLAEAKLPLQKFLIKHTQPREAKFFQHAAKVVWSKEKAEKLQLHDMLVLIPAFAVSEMTAAFEIGFLLYLPFITIDLIISNILLAMGMMMVSPMTISLPFKLLLFVLVDGWSLMIHSLVLTYG